MAEPASDEWPGTVVADAAPHSDEWPGTPVDEAPSAAPSGPSGPPGPSAPSFTDFLPTGKNDHVWQIAKAFGHGLSEPWHEPLGLSPEATQALTKAGIFPENENYSNPFKGANRLLAQLVTEGAQVAYRIGSGIYSGYQEAAVKTGEVLEQPALGRDVASLPDAFFGSPGAHFEPPKIARPIETVRPSPLRPIDSSPAPPMARTVAAQTGLPHVDAVLNSPTTKEVIDNPVVDRSHDVPYMAGGSVPLEDPTVYIDRHVPEKQTVGGITFDPADPWIVHENVEQHTMEMLIKGGMDAQEAYRVAHFEFAEKAEQAWYRAHGIDQEAAEAEQQSWLPQIQHENPENPPPNLYKKPYPHDSVGAAQHEAVTEAPATPDEIARAHQIVEDRADQLEPPVIDLDEAKKLGAVGDEPPPVKQEPLEGENDPWTERWKGFVGKINKPEDVRNLILEGAKDKDFTAARAGEIPLSQVEQVAQAAGVDPTEINRAGLGRLLQNDRQVRVGMNAMLEATEQVKAAARELKAEDKPENLIKLQEAVMRRDLAVEQIVGLRAEWGRTGNVFQEFLRDVKDQETLSNWLKDKGKTTDGLRDIANGLESLDSTQAAKLLNDARTPGFFDKFMWYWVNALISGLVTHGKYIVANGTFGVYDAGVGMVAGGVGTARRALTGSTEGVRLSEGGYALYGLLKGVPDSMRAAVTAFKKNMQVPLPGETALGIVPKRNKNVFFQQQAIGGVPGQVLGLPMKSASAIHSFFNFLGYRASIEKQAARIAEAEGHRGGDFFRRQQEIADQPTEEMMREAIDDGYRLTFIKELGPKGKALTNALNQFPAARLVLPFTHIPANLLKEGTEAAGIGFLQKEVRDNLSGKNGAVKQDMAIARMVVGATAGAWAVSLVGQDRMTGYGPTDPKERAQWYATGHQPYSVRIGDEWISLNRFGPLGTMLGLHANIGEAIPHLKPDAEELNKAVAMTVHSFGRLLEDEVGMQGLANIMQAIEDPQRNGPRVVSSFAGSLLPYSSFLRQTASAMDPDMREAKTVVDGLRYYIPGERQTLLPRRDWAGSPIPNPGYGFDIPQLPGLSAIMQHRSATLDPVALEMQNLNLKPAPPENRINGVQLPPELYDRYQTVAGSLTRTSLEKLLEQPGWQNLPVGVREEVFRQTIRQSRKAAAAMLQASRPDILQTQIENKQRRINGEKPVKLKY